MRVPATPAGYDRLHDFVRSHGRIRMIGIEGTGSYGAGLARALRAAGAPIREVIRPKRSQRRRGKSDPIDAYAAAGRALAEADALPVAKTGTGPCEQIRVLLAWRRSAMKARVAAHRQITALPATAPDAVRTRFARLSGEGAHRRPGSHAPRTDRPPPPHRRPRGHCAARVRRHRIPGRRDHRHRHRAARTDRPRRPDDARHQGAAPSTTATLLAGAGDNPDRIRSEASFAALCGAAPIPAGPREDQPPPTQPRRRPTGQLGAAPDRPGPPVQRPAHQGLRRPPHRHGQEPQRDPALPPNAPSPAKHGTC